MESELTKIASVSAEEAEKLWVALEPSAEKLAKAMLSKALVDAQAVLEKKIAAQHMGMKSLELKALSELLSLLQEVLQ